MAPLGRVKGLDCNRGQGGGKGVTRAGESLRAVPGGRGTNCAGAKEFPGVPGLSVLKLRPAQPLWDSQSPPGDWGLEVGLEMVGLNMEGVGPPCFGLECSYWGLLNV